MKLATILAVMMSLAGCGDISLIILDVQSDLTVPDQIDSLNIVIISPVDQKELKSVDVTLKANKQFPVEVSFNPSESTPTVLEAHVTGNLNGAPVAGVQVLFDWQQGKVNRVPLFPLDPI